MSTANRVIKNTLFLYFRLIITLVVSLWTTRVILFALGIDDFGIYNVVGGAISLLGFLNASLSSSSQRYLSYAEGQSDYKRQVTVFNCCVILHIIIGIILGFIFIVAGIIFFNGVLNIPTDRVFAAKIVYISMGVSALTSVLTVPYEATVNAHENMKYYALIGIIEVFLKLLIAFIIIYTTSDKLIVYACLMSGVHIFTLIIIRSYCRKRYPECKLQLRKNLDKCTIKEIGSFAGWNLMTSSSSMITQYGMNIVVNHFFGVIVNAAQGIANQVSGVLSNLSTNALKALNPVIVKSESQHNRDGMLYISLVGCRISFFIFGFLSLPIMLNMELILNIWLTKVPDWTLLFCQFALIRILLEQLTFGLTTSIMAHGNIKIYNIWRSIAYILPLFIIPILFEYNFEPYWMYIVWIISWSCIGGLITVIFSHKLVNLSIKRYVHSNLSPCLLAWCLPFFLGFTFLKYYNTTNLWQDLSITTLCIITYFVLSWTLILNRDERSMVLQLMYRRVGKN